MNIMIIDTETVTGTLGRDIYQNTVFDVGFVIIDEDSGEIVHKYSALVDEVYSKPQLLNQVYFGMDYLKNYVHPRKSECKSYNEISVDFWNAIEEYGVKDVYAYNANFDKNSLYETSILFKAEKRINIENGLKVKDLYNMACTAIGKSDRFNSFCVDNNFLTAKGNVQSSAEAVYAFIKNDPKFVEEHTALQDSLIEREIYLWCKEQEKKKGIRLPTEPNAQAWRIVQR